MHAPTTTGRIARVVLALIVTATLVAGPLRDGRDAIATNGDALHTTVREDAVSMPSSGAFTVAASTRVGVPTPYLEIRFQLRSPGGRLLFQRTEVRNAVETSTVDVSFTRELSDLSLQPGVYPYEVRVRSEAGEPREQVIPGTLLVHAPDPPSTPTALALRIEGVPAFDPQGLFVVDPETADGTMRSVNMLSSAINAEPDLRCSLIMPPVILDEWARVAAGYQIAGPTGVTVISAEEATPRRYAATLANLRAALATGRLELIDVPYADPDIMGLLATRSLGDLDVHYSRAMSTYLATLETSPSAGTAVASRGVNSAVLDTIAGRGASFVLLPEESLITEEGTATPGPWVVADTPLTALVSDSQAGALIGASDTSATVDHIFARAVSADATVPVPIVCDAGPDGETEVAAFLDLARTLSDVPWATPVLMTDAALVPPLGDADAAPFVWADDAPTDYRQEVTLARRYAHAFESAVGVNDPDSQAVTNASLIAQSRSWAGPDGRWSLADRGRSFSSAATRHARSFLDLIEITAQDITLAGPRGTVPLSITNNSTKNLMVTLRLHGNGLHVAEGESQNIALRPQENIQAVAVDLQSSLSSRLTIEVWTSDVMLASGSAMVRASYLDRLVVIGGVAAVLLGLLYYIRRRVRAADAGKIPSRTMTRARGDDRSRT